MDDECMMNRQRRARQCIVTEESCVLAWHMMAGSESAGNTYYLIGQPVITPFGPGGTSICIRSYPYLGGCGRTTKW